MGPFEWDAEKRRTNLTKHGVDLSLITGFDWDAAFTRADTRGDYGEERFVSLGRIGDRLFDAVWIERGGFCRLISLRKANAREVNLYDKS